MTAPPHWSGREARALREAQGLTVRDFAARLHVGDAAVSKWENRGLAARLWPDTQRKLDAELLACADDARARFERSVREASGVSTGEPARAVRDIVAFADPVAVTAWPTTDDPVVRIESALGALRDSLVALRNGARLTQQQLAVRIGYSRAAVAGAETLSRMPAESFWDRCDEVLAANGVLHAAYQRLAEARAAKDRQARWEADLEREVKVDLWRSSVYGIGRDHFSLDLPRGTPGPYAASTVEVNRAPISRLEVLRCLCGNALATGLLGICGRCGLNQRTVSALSIVTPAGDAGLDVAADSLDELVEHYSKALYTMPSAEAYRELIAGRTYAARMLGGAATGPRRANLTVSAGWLSNLLAVVTSQQGDHAAALVWCADAERQGHTTDRPELAGWAAVTRATIAFYQGDPHRAAAVASQAQQLVPAGTVPHAKLAAQEMRARAMLGEINAAEKAKRRAAESMQKFALTPSGGAGVFSMPVAEDPPYTATSLLFMKRFQEAVYATNRVLDTTYQYVKHGDRQPPTGYARSLLILGLAYAGAGQLDEAAATGRRALSCAPQVWPTMMLAGRLDRALAQKFPDAAPAAQFHWHYSRALSETHSQGRQLVAGPKDL